MSDDMATPRTLMREMMRLSKLIDQGVSELIKQSREYAEAENDYRRAKSQAFFGAPADATVAAKTAHVDATCIKERGRKLIAEGMKLAALEAVRSRRSQLSAAQSIANAIKAEHDLATYTKG